MAFVLEFVNGAGDVFDEDLSRLWFGRAVLLVVYVFSAEGAANRRGLNVSLADSVGRYNREEAVFLTSESYGAPSSKSRLIVVVVSRRHGYEVVCC